MPLYLSIYRTHKIDIILVLNCLGVILVPRGVAKFYYPGKYRRVSRRGSKMKGRKGKSNDLNVCNNSFSLHLLWLGVSLELVARS